MEWELWFDAADGDGIRLMAIKIDVQTLTDLTQALLRSAQVIRIELRRKEVHNDATNPNR